MPASGTELEQRVQLLFGRLLGFEAYFGRGYLRSCKQRALSFTLPLICPLDSLTIQHYLS